MSDSSSNAGSPEHKLAVALSSVAGNEQAAAAHQVETERSDAEASTSGGASTALDVHSLETAVRNDGELTRKRNRIGDLILKERRKQGRMVVSVPDHSATLAAGFQQLRENEQLCDVTVRVDGKDFRAHRAVLAASSEMLNAMLTGQWSDSNDKVIELCGVDRNSFG
jgi:ribosomal protein L34